MTAIAHDELDHARTRRARATTGVLLALTSAAAFGLSGSLARGLLDVGWSAGAAVTARVLVGGLALLVPAVLALRGRWGALRRNAPLVLVYGVVAVAGTQFAYFSAVARLDVGVALLIEFLAPVAVVLWMWLRHGRQPRAMTTAGGLLAIGGLFLVLDLTSGRELSLVGVAWALVAMAGAASYFVISAQEVDVPPVALAAAGLLTGGVLLALAGVAGLVPMAASAAPVTLRGSELPWWALILTLGLVSAALAYVTGIAAGRRLGARPASFMGLTEVLAGVLFAWLLLAQVPGWTQLLGGVAIVGGVVLVRLGEDHA